MPNTFDNVNTTELVEIISEFGFQVNPLLPRERLIEIICQTDPLASELSPFQQMREENKLVLNEHWHSLQLQLITTCKGKCREEGFVCPDLMVLLCHRRMKELRKDKGKSRGTKTYKIVKSPETA